MNQKESKGDINMKLGEFLKLHDGGGACVSIYFYNHEKEYSYEEE